MCACRVIATVAVGVGVVCFAVGHLLGFSFWLNFTFAIGIIVANVPEGLLPTVTLSLAIATRRMARRNALIRHLPAVEALGAATVICTDKTGTLTRNVMTVRCLFLAGELIAPAAIEPQRANARHLLEVAAHCHNLAPTGQPANRRWLGDSMEIALVEFARQHLVPSGWPRVDELPFDPTAAHVHGPCGAGRPRTLLQRGARGGAAIVFTPGDRNGNHSAGRRRPAVVYACAGSVG